jgi:hypothetical protein
MSRKRSYQNLAELLELLDDVSPDVALETLAQALERVLQSAVIQDRLPDEADEALILVQHLRHLAEHMETTDDEPA